MNSHTGLVREVADTDHIRCDQHYTYACVGRTADGHQGTGAGQHDGIIDMSHGETLDSTQEVQEKNGKKVHDHVK